MNTKRLLEYIFAAILFIVVGVIAYNYKKIPWLHTTRVPVVFVLNESATMSIKDKGFDENRYALALNIVDRFLKINNAEVKIAFVLYHQAGVWVESNLRPNVLEFTGAFSDKNVNAGNTGAYIGEVEGRADEALARAYDLIGEKRYEPDFKYGAKIVFISNDLGVFDKEMFDIIARKQLKGVSVSVIGIGSKEGGYVKRAYMPSDSKTMFRQNMLIENSEIKPIFENKFSKLDEDELKRTAILGGGFYFTQDLSDDDIRKILK